MEGIACNGRNVSCICIIYLCPHMEVYFFRMLHNGLNCDRTQQWYRHKIIPSFRKQMFWVLQKCVPSDGLTKCLTTWRSQYFFREHFKNPSPSPIVSFRNLITRENFSFQTATSFIIIGSRFSDKMKTSTTLITPRIRWKYKKYLIQYLYHCSIQYF